MPKNQGLLVTNKYLPANDHRLHYSRQSEVADFRFAMPDVPQEEIEKGNFRLKIGEGLHLSDIREYYSLYKLLVKEKEHLDFVHFNSTGLILVGPTLAKIVGIPCVITITGFGRIFSQDELKYRIIKPVYKALLFISMLISKAIFFQNNKAQQFVSSLYPKFQSKLFYAGSATINPIVKPEPTQEKIKVIHIARLLPSKGVEDFLIVADALSCGDFEFILIGPSSKGYEELETLVREYDRKGRIKYLGELSPPETWAYLVDSDILFFPSYGEGMSRVMLEAGFAGVCPIAYDIDANLDLVKEGQGFLVSVGDTKAVIEILRNLSIDRDLIIENAKEYQEFIIKYYSIEKYTERMDNHLRNLFFECKREKS